MRSNGCVAGSSHTFREAILSAKEIQKEIQREIFRTDMGFLRIRVNTNTGFHTGRPDKAAFKVVLLVRCILLKGLQRYGKLKKEETGAEETRVNRD